MNELKGICFLFAILMSAETVGACRYTISHHTNGEAHLEKLDENLSTVQRSRLNTIERECRKYDADLKLHSRKDSIPHMIVDDERKLLFCDIPKVASSNWKRVFIDALNITVNGSSNIRDVHAKNLLPDLRHYTPEEQDYRLKNYFKFTFVRHPLERLLSAYRNKLENREIEWTPVKKHWVDPTGRLHNLDEMVLRVKNGGEKNSNTNRAMTFSQFINTLTDPTYSIRHINTHWKQYSKLCHPCFVRYDFVGKLETFAEDTEFIRRKTGLEYGNWFKQTDRTTLPSVADEYYKSLSPWKVTAVINMYDADLSMFEYDTS